MQALTHEYWMFYLKKIIKIAFLPWVVYSAVSLFYFTHTLKQEFAEAEGTEAIIW